MRRRMGSRSLCMMALSKWRQDGRQVNQAGNSHYWSGWLDPLGSEQPIHRGYYMAARRYEISLRVLKNISRVSAANE